MSQKSRLVKAKLSLRWRVFFWGFLTTVVVIGLTWWWDSWMLIGLRDLILIASNPLSILIFFIFEHLGNSGPSGFNIESIILIAESAFWWYVVAGTVEAIRRRRAESVSVQRVARAMSPLRVGWALAGLPLALVLIACAPVVNVVVFSSHTGLGWLLLPVCFPLFMFNLYRLVIRPRHEEGKPFRMLSAGICLGYLVLAYPFGAVAEQRLTADSGRRFGDHMFWREMTLPVSLLLPTANYGIDF